MKQIYFEQSVSLGSDPEFNFSSEGLSIGSEKILPENGLDVATHGKIVIDGVNAELNPVPNTCRALAANSLAACFRKLAEQIKDKKVNLEFRPLFKVTRQELNSLSEKSRIFGCVPSQNNFDPNNSTIKVNPKKYLKRSCGGHVHLGPHYNSVSKALSEPKILVPIADIVLHNTCVLLDRNPDNVERRRVYGKCSEYRKTPYKGIELRTLSNFWLRAYPLMSFVYGMARMVVLMVSQSKEGNDYVKALREAVSYEDVYKAVQENNFDLAYQNFSKIQQILLDAAGGVEDHIPISHATIKEFHHFVAKGVDYWFDHDSFQHWLKLPEAHGHGWESMMQKRVREDMLHPKKQLAEKTFAQIWMGV